MSRVHVALERNIKNVVGVDRMLELEQLKLDLNAIEHNLKEMGASL